jgi:formyl-CoA transferase
MRRPDLLPLAVRFWSDDCVAMLDGVLVADFSRVLAGPYATMALADLGATVVKVERPGVGDETRGWGPPWAASGASTYYESLNRSKLGLALDFADDTDLARARELARRADVVVHNLRGIERFGLDYDSVAAANPRVVYCTISGFGPHSSRPGYDFLVQAMGGVMSVTGDADGEPRKVGIPIVDVLTGKDATIGILAALTARERTGVGEHVQVALLSSILGGLVNQGAGYLETGRSPRRMGNAHPSLAPYETLRCADGLIAVACGNDVQFARLVTELGRPELAADERFVTNGGRVEHRDELVAVLEALLATDTVASWEVRLGSAGVPCGQVADIATALATAAEVGLEPLVDVGPDRQIRHPISYARAVTAPATAPPALGEHAPLILDWLDDPAAAPLPPGSTR